MKQIFLICCLLVLQANAQQVRWVKQSFSEIPNFGLSSPNVWATPSGHFFHLNNYGASAQTDTGAIVQGAGAVNALVSFMDANGGILHEFTMEGVQPFGQEIAYDTKALMSCLLNDSELVFLASAQNVFINGTQKTDSLVFNGYRKCMRLYKLSNTGALTSIITLPVWADGIVSNGSMGILGGYGYNMPNSLSVDIPHQRAFVSFSCSVVDTLVFDTNYFKPNTTTVLQVNLATGTIDKHWIFPVEFDGVSVLGDNIILSGRSQGFNYTYSINGSTYSRDSSTDLTTNDIVMASFNTVSNTYNWHRQFKVRSPYDLTNWVIPYNMDQTVYLRFRYQDTVTIDGVEYGTLIPFSTQEYEMIIAIDQSGIKWINEIKGGHIFSVFKATHQPSGISCTINAKSELIVNGIQLNKTIPLGPNFVAFNETGGVVRSFNAAFASIKNTASVFGVDYADSTLIVGRRLYNTDSVLLGGKYYKKHKSGYFAEDLLFSFKSSAGDVPTGLTTAPTASMNKIQVYPNPAQTQLRLAGMDAGSRVNICIYDLMGKQVVNKRQSSDDTIDISALTPGAYFVQIYTDTLNQTVKLIVE